MHDIAFALSRARDGAERGPLLDELARRAVSDAVALNLLLSAIVEHDLADVSVRKVFFDEGQIDDAVQETVLAVAGSIHGYRGDASFLTWLDRVATNAARQMRRRGQRLSEPVSNEVPDHGAWVRRISSVVADEIVVADAFEQLNPEHARVIVLREVENLSYEQIAEQLGVPIGTVRSRLSRARSELAQHLVTLQRGT